MWQGCKLHKKSQLANPQAIGVLDSKTQVAFFIIKNTDGNNIYIYYSFFFMFTYHCCLSSWFIGMIYSHYLICLFVCLFVCLFCLFIFVCLLLSIILASCCLGPKFDNHNKLCFNNGWIREQNLPPQQRAIQQRNSLQDWRPSLFRAAKSQVSKSRFRVVNNPLNIRPYFRGWALGVWAP